MEGLKWLDSGRNLLLTILYKTVYYRNQLFWIALKLHYVPGFRRNDRKVDGVVYV